MSTDQIPKSLQYGASQSQARVVRQTIMPLGSNSGTTTAQSSFRFKLPEKSLIDLRSLSFYYDYTITGLTDDANNWSNALIPASYKHWQSVKFYVSGAVAANHLSNHYDLAYHALVRASASEDWVNSRWNNGYIELISGADAVATNDLSARPGAGNVSRTAHMIFDDILGLPNSKNHVLDTSLFGSVEIELIMTNNTSIKCSRAGTISAADLSASLVGTISGIQCQIDTVVSVSPLYVSLLAERLQVDSPIRVPFQNIATQIASNTGSNRFTLNSSCVDAIVVGFMSADPNSFPADATQNVLNANRYRFNSGRTVGNANASSFQISVGSEVFPRQPQRLDRCSDLTTNSIYGNSAKSTNLLFAGLAAGAQTYARSKYLDENCIVIQKFMLGDEGWNSGLLQGVDCSSVSTDFVVNSSNAGSWVFICALMSSQLVFNPSTSSVSVQV